MMVVGPKPKIVFEVIVRSLLAGIVWLDPSVMVPMRAPPSRLIRQLVSIAGAPSLWIVVESLNRLDDKVFIRRLGPVMLAVVMSVPWRLFWSVTVRVTV